YQDAANARREVTAALHRGQRALGKTPSLATAEFGPASPAVTAARRADSDINLAISHLNEAFVPYVEPFGGVHTQVNLTRLNEARALIARTTGAVETTVRRAVNAG
ncbi:MAG: hypothetical protein JWN72_2808, partial [Thermoleophilia bacterium]|nr:hypothetical protein [Thermoleophilia bacterium]